MKTQFTLASLVILLFYSWYCASFMRRIKHSFVIFYGIICLVFAGSAPNFVDFEQNSSLIQLFKWRGERTPPDNVAIVSINSESAKHLDLPAYTGNWPREIYAELIEQLIQYQAKLIVFDIYFKDARDPESDQRFSQAIAKANNVILFKYLKRHQLNQEAGFIDIEEEQLPLDIFTQGAIASGAFTLPKYPARVTQAKLYMELSGGRQATQPLLAYQAAMGQPSIENIKHQNDSVFINFYGPPKTLKTIPIHRVINKQENEELSWIKDRVVYVGFVETQQTEQRDAYRTAFSNELGVDLSGVEISATVFANLMDDSYLRAPKTWLMPLVVLGIFIFVATAFRFGRNINICAQAIFGTTYLMASWLLFTKQNFWLPILGPFLALAAANAACLTRSYLVTHQNFKNISNALENFLPRHAARNIGKNLSTLEKQYNLVHGICLVTDIQGYTSLSEKLEPTELHSLMNSYYDKLVNAVRTHNGFVGNIVGDSLLALWTGPNISEDMCKQALACAVDILKSIDADPEIKSQLKTCVALHGGQFSLGNLGASGHFEYSPVGDIINTSTRVEHFNRNLRTQFLCTQIIADHLLRCEAIDLIYVGDFALRNKAKKTAMYTVNHLDDNLKGLFSAAVAAYHQGHFEQAEQLFNTIQAQTQHGPTEYYIQELKNLCI